MAMTNPSPRPGIGNRVAPLRFLLFAAIALIVTPVAISLGDWRTGAMIGFDVATAAFLVSLIPLYRKHGDAEAMRASAIRNDANRVELLAVSALVSIVVLVAIAAELTQKHSSNPAFILLIITTLALSWTFSNLVYALHYAHLFYTPSGKGKDSGGIEIPGVAQPDYWDFTYYAFTLGMTFQTSDTQITSRDFRRLAIFHGFAAFVFNIGVLAFTINILGS